MCSHNGGMGGRRRNAPTNAWRNTCVSSAEGRKTGPDRGTRCRHTETRTGERAREPSGSAPMARGIAWSSMATTSAALKPKSVRQRTSFGHVSRLFDDGLLRTLSRPARLSWQCSDTLPNRTRNYLAVPPRRGPFGDSGMTSLASQHRHCVSQKTSGVTRGLLDHPG